MTTWFHVVRFLLVQFSLPNCRLAEKRCVSRTGNSETGLNTRCFEDNSVLDIMRQKDRNGFYSTNFPQKANGSSLNFKQD